MIFSFVKTFTYNMIVIFHTIAFLLNEYFTPVWQKNVRDISREVVAAMYEVDENTAGTGHDVTGIFLKRDFPGNYP